MGYAGRAAVSNSPGTSSARVNGIAPNKATIQAVYLGGPRYPFARKLYVNTLRGFEFLRNSDATVAGSDAEESLVACFSTLPFDGTIDVESPTIGLIKLPPADGEVVERPLCEDFDGAFTCADTSNTDACLGNEAIGGGVGIPTSYCNNGLQDGDERFTDVCPPARPTCNPATRHCE